MKVILLNPPSPLFDAYTAAILEKEDVEASILDAQLRDLNLT